MAINPNISLGVKPVEIENPAVWQARALQARNAQQNAAMNDIQLEEHRQKLAAGERRNQANAKLSELLAKHSTPDANGKLSVDHGGVYKGLAESGYGDLAIEYDKARRADMKAAAEQAKADLENLKTKSQMVGQLLGAVRQAPDDQKAQAYQIARQWGVQRGIISEQDAPAEFDPQFVETAFQSAIDADKQIDNARADLDYDLRVSTHEQAILQNAPKTDDAWTTAAARVLGAATNAEQWEVGKKSLIQSGIPRAVLQRFGDPFDAERANDLGMTPDQRAMNADRDKPKPGVDVPFSPDVAAQKKELAAAGRSQVTVNTAERANFKDETTLRKEFSDLPTVKAANEVASQIKRAREAFAISQNGGSTNSSDQVIVTVLNKVLDPNSVVRESEYARTAEGQSILSRLEGSLQRMKSGGAGISPDERKSVMQTIEALGAAMDKQYKPIVEQYRGLAGEYGFNPDRIVRPMTAEAPKAAPSNAPKVGTVRNGYVFMGGDPAQQSSWKAAK